MIVGLTGAIGSGKSSVSHCFQALDVPVIDADAIAHELSAKDQPAYLGIVAHFGEKAIGQNGELDRDYLRDIVFDDPAQREALNQITHPLIFAEMQARSAASKAPYCIWDVPLLIGGISEKAVDRILVVHAPLQSRKAWIRARNGWDDAMIESVMASQPAPEELLAHADDVIHNLGSKADLCDEVSVLHKDYLSLASAAST